MDPEKVWKILKELDLDDSETLNFKDFKTGLERGGVPRTNHDLKAMFKLFPKD